MTQTTQSSAMTYQHARREPYSQSEIIINSQESNDLSLTKILPKLLPLLIRLIFEKNETSKIETITQIGSVLNMEDIVCAALTSVNSGDLAASQLNE